jgi:hypothetical protein
MPHLWSLWYQPSGDGGVFVLTYKKTAVMALITAVC